MCRDEAALFKGLPVQEAKYDISSDDDWSRLGANAFRKAEGLRMDADAQQRKREGNAKGGRARSLVKALAVRLNGLKGGRPKKAAPELVPSITEIVQREWERYQKEHPEFKT